jgi:hypothetical protein
MMSLPEMTLAKDHDVIEAFTPHRADEPFNVTLCQGEHAAIGQSRIPMAASRGRTTSP